MAEIVKTRHARFAVDRRGLSRGELRAAIYHPDSVEPGKSFGTERRIKDGIVAVVHPTRRKLLLITAYRLGEMDQPSD